MIDKLKSIDEYVMLLDGPDGLHVIKETSIIGYRVTYDEAGKPWKLSVLAAYAGAFPVHVRELHKLETLFGVYSTKG